MCIFCQDTLVLCYGAVEIVAFSIIIIVVVVVVIIIIISVLALDNILQQ